MVQPIEVSIIPVSEVRYRMVLDADQLRMALVSVLVKKGRIDGDSACLKVERCHLRIEGTGAAALVVGAEVEVSVDSSRRKRVDVYMADGPRSHPDSAAIHAHSADTGERKPDFRTM